MQSFRISIFTKCFIWIDPKLVKYGVHFMITSTHQVVLFSVNGLQNIPLKIGSIITLFRSTTVLCGTHNIMQNIPHIHTEYEEYFMEYC